MTAHHFKFYFRASISSDGQKLIYVNTIVKKGMIIIEGLRLWFKNYYVLTSFMWCPLTLSFRP